MPTYKQTVQFVRVIKITARDAAEANQMLSDLVSETEVDGNVECDGWREFEDEPVECPICKGDGEIIHDDSAGGRLLTCSRCNGEGTVPFSADKAVL